MGTGALARPGGAKLRSFFWFAVSNAILSSLFESLLPAAFAGEGACATQHHFARRLYFFSTSRRRSWGRPMTSKSLIPFIVLAATMALTIASSVA